jgi:hypothetical protein
MTIYPTFPDYILLDSRNARPTARRRILGVACPNRLSLPDVARLRKQEEQAAAVHNRFTLTCGLTAFDVARLVRTRALNRFAIVAAVARPERYPKARDCW